MQSRGCIAPSRRPSGPGRRMRWRTPISSWTGRWWSWADFSIGVAYATRSLGQRAARSGDLERAAELYDAAREQFRSMVAESELVDTDARIAELLVIRGVAAEAIEIADSALRRTSAVGGATQ